MSPYRGFAPSSDQELVAAIDQGDRRAFEVLYRRHRDWAHRLAWRFTRDDDLAADIVQDCFLYLLGKFPGFALSCRLTTFLYPVIRNLSLRALERSRRHVADDGQLDRRVAPVPVSDGRAEIEAALEGLSEIHREIVLMRFVDDLKIDEIAQILDLAAGTVKSRLHNALAQLRRDPGTRKFFED